MTDRLPRVVVLDYGIGNVHSAAKALEEVGANVELSADKREAIEADGLVIPGVGAFASVMAALNAVGASEIVDRRLAGGRHVLGICVGMQVMFEHGIERGMQSPGLGQWPGTVTTLESPVLPHVGWNAVSTSPDSKLFTGLEQELFYFVHSNAALNWQLPEDSVRAKPILTWANFGGDFLAAVENGPLSATQFHPEKSGIAGLKLLRNWILELKHD